MRCSAKTREGAQCKKQTFGPGDLCFVHRALQSARENRDAGNGEGLAWRDQLTEKAALAESASKLFLVLAAASYFAGLLTTNFYLLRWGVVDFSVVKTKYILTGGAFFFLSLCGYVPFYCAWSILRDAFLRGYTPRERGLLVTVKTAISLAVVLVLWWTVATHLFDHEYAISSLFIVGEWQVIWRILVLGIAGACSHEYLTNPLLAGRRSPWRQMGAALLLLIWTGSLMFFGRTLFPRINPQFGGARPLHARVLLEPELAEVLPSGVAAPNAIAEWTLIHERGDDYLFAVFDKGRRSVNVFSVPRRLVRGVLVDEKLQYERRVEDIKDGAVYSADPETWSIILAMSDHFPMSDIVDQTNLLESDISNLLLIWRVLGESVEDGRHLEQHGELIRARPEPQHALIHFLYSEALARHLGPGEGAR